MSAQPEMAVLYALGMLTAQEASDFERTLTDRDRDCLAALRDGTEEAAALAVALPPAQPGPAVKARLMRRVRTRNVEGFGALLAGEGIWKETGHDGVSFKPLYFDKTTGLVTLLLRLKPGAKYPAHIHSRTEQCLVLEGDVSDASGSYSVGDFTWAEPGSVHRDVHTRNGSLLLLVVAPENEMIDF